MKRKLLSLTLALTLTASLCLPAAAAAPEAALRDVQTHTWTVLSDEVLEAEMDDQSDPAYFWFYYTTNTTAYAANPSCYNVNELLSGQPAHFMLYDNGDLYLSTKENPDASSFSKVMEDVKEIAPMTVPLYQYRMVVANRLSDTQYNTYNSTYSDVYIEERVETAVVTTILDNSGNLYVMGSPDEMDTKNYELTHTDYSVPGHQRWTTANSTWMSDQAMDFRVSLTIADLYPFSYQASPETAQKLSDGIERIAPSYAYTYPYENWMAYGVGGSTQTATGQKGFYVDRQGNSYLGFPTQKASNQLLEENVIDCKYSIQMQEDGCLYQDGSKIASNIKDFGTKAYLTNDGKLYNYSGKLLSDQVKSISYDGAFFISEDDSLYAYDGDTKVMEDAAAVFGRNPMYAVRSNGDVCRLDYGENNVLLPKKVISGNGYEPNPGPTLHDGKVFKDASEWALIDLRAARDSGLTLPVDGLSYNQPITREKFAEVAVRLYEKLSGSTAPAAGANPFTDTVNPEILKAYSLGIVKGTSATTFSPQDQITRESIATMLKRVADLTGTRLPNGSAKQFTDAGQIASWARDAVEAMAAANVVKGIGNDSFGPQGTATIEQSIIMANRMLP